MPRRLSLLMILVVAVATAGVASAATRPTPAQRRAAPTVIVALADSGINPYHQAFYRPQNTAHPCTWVRGFSDCSIPALPLTIGTKKSYAEAVAADRAVWEWAEVGQWYWIPKTNIIGAVCSVEQKDGPGETPQCILDSNGHGTATASSVLSEAPDALLLMNDSNAGALEMARPPVIPDVQSHSWGAATPLPLHATAPLPNEYVDICPAARRQPETLFFIAAGNEAPFPTVVDCERTMHDVNVVGGAYPGHWNTGSWSVYDFASWYCRPAADGTSTTTTSQKCGTSMAAPTAAGAAAAALLKVRRHDRYNGRSTMQRVSPSVTRAQFDAALRNGASYSPKPKYPQPTDCKPPYSDCVSALGSGPVPITPELAPFLWGYGWLDSTVVDAVVSCALRRACPAKSAEAQKYNETRHQLRDVQHRDAVSGLPQSDAESKRDAGDDPDTSVAIKPDNEYTGSVEPYVVGGDMEDWYTFRAVKGQRVTVYAGASIGGMRQEAPGQLGCWNLRTASGSHVGGGTTKGVRIYETHCGTGEDNPPPTDVVVPRTGTYTLVYFAHNGTPPHDYDFQLTLTRR
jgi:hypothetical protein